jgi:hypothetical protein
VHVAALPLLVPTWASLAAGWWVLSPGHSPSDLAILSLAVYEVVTPAHEALHDLLWAGGPLRPRLASLTGARSPSAHFRQPVPACIALSASS